MVQARPQRAQADGPVMGTIRPARPWLPFVVFCLLLVTLVVWADAFVTTYQAYRCIGDGGEWVQGTCIEWGAP